MTQVQEVTSQLPVNTFSISDNRTTSTERRSRSIRTTSEISLWRSNAWGGSVGGGQEEKQKAHEQVQEEVLEKIQLEVQAEKQQEEKEVKYQEEKQKIHVYKIKLEVQSE